MAKSVRLMKYVFPEDVKIPSLDHLIGRSITWDEGYFDWETGESVESLHTGIIVGYGNGRIFIELENKEVWNYNPSVLYHSTPADVQQAVNNYDTAISHKNHLAHKQAKDHDVYALIDPRNKSVRYVGMSKNAQSRYEAHILGHSDNEEKEAWILELKTLGLLPELVVLEKVKGRITAFQREQYWIGYYIAQGASLTNKLKEIEE